MPVLRPDLMFQVREFGPVVVVRLDGGVLMATEEELEVRMRAPRDAAATLRLALDDRDLHGRYTRRRLKWMMREEGAATFTGRDT
jgi:hypothetical protein